MRPALQAAIDQADAAQADAAGSFARLAEAMNTEVVNGVRPGRPTRKVLAKLVERAAAGTLKRCAHLPGWSAPAHWCAWRSSKLRCPPCLARAGGAVRGTTEDHRCDACRRHDRRGLRIGSVLLPAVVIDLGDGAPVTSGPVTAYFGLCGRCHRASVADETPAVPHPRGRPA